MAVSKKYAGLPDLDAAPEVYETPDLADDVSTAQTGTVRTISPSPSDEDGQPGLDRQPLDRDGARRRFEPSVVDAKDVNFSDTIGGTRRSYRTRSSRRRRRRRQENGVEELGDLSDSEEETLGRKLARLKREAEEVRLELEKREQEKDKDGDGEFQDSVEQQQHGQQQGDEDEDADVDGIEELGRALDGLSMKVGSKSGGTVEDEFLSRLDSSSRRRLRQAVAKPTDSQQQQKDEPVAAPSALSAVAAFSDRLTALEAALGITSTSETSQTTCILPTLENLSSQITTLSNTLMPKTSMASSSLSNTTPLLDTVSSKLKTLIAESDRLTTSRKQAQQSLSDLHELRMRQLVSATVHTNTRPRRGLSNASSANQVAGADLAGPGEESLQLQSQLFLDEQSAKITALYQLLPSIQDLQPLLPVVLERLRALSVIHAGAADAKSNLDAVEKRQAETREELKQWRVAVEHVEKGMAELEETMKGNVKVVGDMVSGLESRIGRLDEGR
ncbi:uncharacterized protein Z518_09455 [Rhinocladiella mackenziei CBS 650.93]|uniref:Rhinocladiella mackenziei CBS 650.93 unplaced genomic scaffold supercont1.7, whole genome shotgun sequence n=1 Tax=Rhinocladiella mackenziei CBS 650.93 TaxID=1442369 RepID=A0A0D2I7B1_9EURO|nr:uncharacterized protein Z518_09455 [Rhinocladiella mackenziei CBS 650.93]KIX01729.1 hypothetical protein Z518_09455 [Rhinocladiella mackenziei CBS 650.93]